jgi:hypothetical protein
VGSDVLWCFKAVLQLGMCHLRMGCGGEE